MVIDLFTKAVNRNFLRVPTKLYGKLPAHGDFISRGLDRQALDKVDIWLSEIVSRSQNIWGKDYSDNFRAAQPWLFGGQKLTAIIMPSTDKVGRLYPILATVESGIPIQKLYDCVHSAVSDDWLCDALMQKLLELTSMNSLKNQLGWYLPEKDYLSLPHPLNGESEVLKVFMK